MATTTTETPAPNAPPVMPTASQDAMTVIRFFASCRRLPCSADRVALVCEMLGFRERLQEIYASYTVQDQQNKWDAIRVLFRLVLRDANERPMWPSEIKRARIYMPPYDITLTAGDLIRLCEPCETARAAALRIVERVGVRDKREPIDLMHNARNAAGGRVWTA